LPQLPFKRNGKRKHPSAIHGRQSKIESSKMIE